MKSGDKVTIKKPKDITEAPGWIETNAFLSVGMDKFDGLTFEVDEIRDETDVTTGPYQAFSVKNPPGGWSYFFRTTWILNIEQKCDCSVRDLLTFGHKCGRLAPIDRR